MYTAKQNKIIQTAFSELQVIIDSMDHATKARLERAFYHERQGRVTAYVAKGLCVEEFYKAYLAFLSTEYTAMAASHLWTLSEGLSQFHAFGAYLGARHYEGNFAHVRIDLPPLKEAVEMIEFVRKSPPQKG